MKPLTRILGVLVGLLLAAPAVGLAAPCCPTTPASPAAWQGPSCCCPAGDCRIVEDSCADAAVVERAVIAPQAASQALTDLSLVSAFISVSPRYSSRRFALRADDPPTHSRPLAAVSLPARL